METENKLKIGQSLCIDGGNLMFLVRLEEQSEELVAIEFEILNEYFKNLPHANDYLCFEDKPVLQIQGILDEILDNVSHFKEPGILLKHLTANQVFEYFGTHESVSESFSKLDSVKSETDLAMKLKRSDNIVGRQSLPVISTKVPLIEIESVMKQMPLSNRKKAKGLATIKNKVTQNGIDTILSNEKWPKPRQRKQTLHSRYTSVIFSQQMAGENEVMRKLKKQRPCKKIEKLSEIFSQKTQKKDEILIKTEPVLAKIVFKREPSFYEVETLQEHRFVNEVWQQEGKLKEKSILEKELSQQQQSLVNINSTIKLEQEKNETFIKNVKNKTQIKKGSIKKTNEASEIVINMSKEVAESQKTTRKINTKASGNEIKKRQNYSHFQVPLSPKRKLRSSSGETDYVKRPRRSLRLKNFFEKCTKSYN